ncbi:MAG: hypothetical protein NT040_13255 [Bacteroidetes bacterium]|nr:hypothetical protein [Bacteroidota bacterium]
MKTNDLLKTYSGIFGNQVILKNRGRKTVMTMPKARRPQKPSEKQLTWRTKFRIASRNATNLLKDPVILAAYRAKAPKGLTAYNLALSDYLNPPAASRAEATGLPARLRKTNRSAVRAVFNLPEEPLYPVAVDVITTEQQGYSIALPAGYYDSTATFIVSVFTKVYVMTVLKIVE